MTDCLSKWIILAVFPNRQCSSVFPKCIKPLQKDCFKVCLMFGQVKTIKTTRWRWQKDCVHSYKKLMLLRLLTGYRMCMWSIDDLFDQSSIGTTCQRSLQCFDFTVHLSELLMLLISGYNINPTIYSVQEVVADIFPLKLQTFKGVTLSSETLTSWFIITQIFYPADLCSHPKNFT